MATCCCYRVSYLSSTFLLSGSGANRALLAVLAQLLAFLARPLSQQYFVENLVRRFLWTRKVCLLSLKYTKKPKGRGLLEALFWGCEFLYQKGSGAEGFSSREQPPASHLAVKW